MQISSNVKATARRLIDELPDNTSWEKLLYTLQVRHDIEAGLKDSEAGNVVDGKRLRRELGMNEYEGRMDAPLDTPPSADT